MTCLEAEVDTHVGTAEVGRQTVTHVMIEEFRQLSEDQSTAELNRLAHLLVHGYQIVLLIIQLY